MSDDMQEEEKKTDEPSIEAKPETTAPEAASKQLEVKKEKPKRRLVVDENLLLAFRYFDRTGES